jgi:hypothetical protein
VREDRTGAVPAGEWGRRFRSDDSLEVNEVARTLRMSSEEEVEVETRLRPEAEADEEEREGESRLRHLFHSVRNRGKELVERIHNREEGGACTPCEEYCVSACALTCRVCVDRISASADAGNGGGGDGEQEGTPEARVANQEGETRVAGRGLGVGRRRQTFAPSARHRPGSAHRRTIRGSPLSVSPFGSISDY